MILLDDTAVFADCLLVAAGVQLCFFLPEGLYKLVVNGAVLGRNLGCRILRLPASYAGSLQNNRLNALLFQVVSGQDSRKPAADYHRIYPFVAVKRFARLYASFPAPD